METSTKMEVSVSSKRSSSLNLKNFSMVSERSSLQRYNELHEKIEEMCLSFLEKTFECRDSRVMHRSRTESKKLASNLSQQNLDFR